MGTIAVVAADPILGAVLQDRLRHDGHTVTLLAGNDALAAATTADLDLAILEVERDSLAAGIALVARLRRTEEWQAVPFLLLASSPEVSDRVAALRAGADDYLTKPCDLEEVVLRASRLASRARSVESHLQGDLANFPIWELMQFIANAEKSGELRLRSSEGDGRMSVSSGQVVAARWGRLSGRAAMITMCGLTNGTFELASRAATLPGVGPVAMIHEALLRSAWLRDELARRAERLPRTSAVLKRTGGVPDAASLDLDTSDLPLDEVLDHVAGATQARLFDLLRSIARPPAAIRLAVAVLVEAGALASAPTDDDDAPLSTAALTSSLLLETAVTDLLGVARGVGFGTSALPFAIAAGGSAWPRLLELVADAGAYQEKSLERFAQQLATNSWASLSLPCDLGRLVLHLVRLSAASLEMVETMVATSAGVLLWTDSATDRATLTSVVARAEAMREPVSGLLIVPPAQLGLATELIAGTARWRVTTHEPYSFLGLFGLLRPRPPEW